MAALVSRAHPRSFLVAPDSFKGTLSSFEVAEALARGVRAEGTDADLCPLADGGEGTMHVLLEALGGRYATAAARDPLGREIEARFVLLAAAIRAGARRVLVSAGGSATTDGGAGAIEAIAAAGGLGGAALAVLCDVTTPFEDA